MLNPRILDRIFSGICIVDRKLNVLVWNLEMENITGVPGQEISGKNLLDFFPGFSDESILLRLQMVLSGGAPIVFSPLLHKDLFRTSSWDSDGKYLEITVTSLLSDSGEETLLFTVRNVTELNLQILKYRQMRDTALEEVRLRQVIEKELQEANNKLQELANTDPLTGLLNRRSMKPLILREVERFDRQNTPFSLILCDIDFFKKFNDTYGHDCGDTVLTIVSKTMKENLRSLDVVSRWGGEEFLILLPGTELTEGREVADKLRLMIADCVCSCGSDHKELSVCMTFGLSEFRAGDDLEVVIKRADTALYKGKEKGRNCVVVSEE
ncbi:MAG: diguanylate cyclase [Spirochaetales bacterium]|nr:diguanylate cyclase [Spirochaetales bacterium]